MNNTLIENLLIDGEAPKTVANLLYIAVGGLITVVTYMYVTHKKELKEINLQSRNQEIETLKVLSELTNFLKEQQSSSADLKAGINSIDKTTIDSNKTINNLARVIQDKILKM